MDGLPLNPELELLLSDYQLYLKQWDYRQADYRLAVARDFLHWWKQPVDHLQLDTWQAYRQQASTRRGQRIFAFRQFLEETGHWRPRLLGPEEQPLDQLPLATGRKVQAYLHRRKLQGQASKDRMRVRRQLLHFLTRLPVVQQQDLTLISADQVEAYIEDQQDHHLAAPTINARLCVLRGFFAWLHQQGAYPGDPPVRNDHYLRQPLPVPRALCPEDVRALLAVLDDAMDRALFLLLLRSGIRVGELIALHQADVDLNQATLIVRCGKKNARGRVVFLAPDALQALQVWLRQRPRVPVDRLFFTQRSHRLSLATVRGHFLDYLKKAGVDRHYRVHDLRHTFATDLLNAGVPITTLQQLLGHRSLAVTQRYAQVADATKRAHYFAAMEKIQQQELEPDTAPQEDHHDRTAS